MYFWKALRSYGDVSCMKIIEERMEYKLMESKFRVYR